MLIFCLGNCFGFPPTIGRFSSLRVTLRYAGKACQKRTHLRIGPIHKLRRKLHVVSTAQVTCTINILRS